MESILSVQNLSIHLKDRQLVENLSFDIQEGDAVLLSGANGIGKSTILKAILCLEVEEKKISGKIVERSFGNVLALDADKLQQYRAKVAYIQQKDEYSEMGNIQVRDIISEGGESHTGKYLSYNEVNEIIDQWIPRKEDGTRVFDAKSKPAKFSGGEQRLLSVLSVIASRSDAELIIIDEPLNNLDFANARNISNLLNRVIHDNHHMGLLMISHCRIFPFITREIKIENGGIVELPNHYNCHSCFGEADVNGFYN